MTAPAYGYPAAGPSMRDPTAVMGRRIGAFFLDALVALVLFGIIFAATSEKVTVEQARTKYGCVEQSTGFNDRSTSLHCPNHQVITIGDNVYITRSGGTFGLDALASFLYFALLPGLTGWTLGKLLLGLRVVDANGQRAGIGRNAIRWIVFIVDAFILFLPGLIAALTSKGHRRIGDMAAGTFVVDHRALGTPPLLGPQHPPQSYGAPQPYAAPPPPAAPAPPVWDAARNTYVQHDPSTGRYLQWDAANGTWKALDT
jgi:uncharacterized RDD family membrane protein YckC